MKHSDIVSKLTLREKAALCSGKDYWHLVENERLGLPSIMVTDGPHGLRKQGDVKKDKTDMLMGVPAVCYPPAATSACSWDPDLLYEMGVALGEECLKEKVSVLLGPGINMKRSPLCGRNFEYFSEDPCLAGELAAGFVNGVQSKGVGTSLKHFAANNQEARRMTIDSVVDERTLREIYLPAFETTVKKAQPWTVMNSYNRLNGTYAAENKWLLTDVLREDWGFKGIVVTDWGAENDRVEGLKAGQELEMPSSNGLGTEKIVKAVQSGELDEAVLDSSVDRIIDMILRSKEVLGDYSYDEEAHHRLARRIAGESMQLLKNEEAVLPIKKGQTVAVIGEMARSPRYQGAGSSLINPTKLDNAFNEFLNEGVGILYSAGYSKNGEQMDWGLISDAVRVARSADVALVFIGLTESYESEGFDRKSLALPTTHNALVEAVAAANENTVVILSGGSAVAMPWLSKVKGVLNAGLGGQAMGSAIVDIVTGKVNPSGKLAETYPLALEDCPSSANFPGSRKTVEYREGIYIGYRYFDTAKKEVLFPFGFGLSYTEFKYSAIKLSKKKIADTEELKVSFKLKNVGALAGAEIAQLYVKDTDSTVYRPEKELKAFKKVYLEPGEERTVELTLDSRAFAFYNVAIHDWYVESGDFEIMVGASSRDIRLSAKVNVSSSQPEAEIPDYSQTAKCYFGANVLSVADSEFEAVLGRPIPPTRRDPSEPLTAVNTLEDAEDTRNGAAITGFIRKILDKVSQGNIGGTGDMLTAMALQLPIRNFTSMSMGVFTEEMQDGLLEILNDGKIRRGVCKIIKGLSEGLRNIKNLSGII